MADQVAGTKRKAAESAEELRGKENSTVDYSYAEMLGPNLDTLQRLVGNRECTHANLVRKSDMADRKLEAVNIQIKEEKHQHKERLHGLEQMAKKLEREKVEADRQLEDFSRALSSVEDTHTAMSASTAAASISRREHVSVSKKRS